MPYLPAFTTRTNWRHIGRALLRLACFCFGLSCLTACAVLDAFDEWAYSLEAPSQPPPRSTPQAPPPEQSSMQCPPTMQTKLRADNPTIKVSYTEPKITVADAPRLSKTTIYIDTGSGGKPVKEVPASNPSGGGNITETVSVTAHKDTVATICVTGTDTAGRESPPTQ